ncbi:MAG: AMP-binding protein [Myxococcota bacterium]|nr:AMP-binding protein [Myxococcota bacterium]
MPDRDERILAHLVASRRDAEPDLEVLTFENGNDAELATRTYAELYDNAERLAGCLVARGMRPGDRFAVLLRNHPEVVELLVAASISGCVVVPIDPRTRGEKLRYVLEDAGCQGVICADYNVGQVQEVGFVGPGTWALVLGEGGGSGLPSVRDAVAAADPLREVRCLSGENALQILYTSGTTGDPKGIVKPNESFAIMAGAVPAVLGLSRQDRLYTGLSLTHGNAQGFTLAPSLGAGIASVFSERFTKSRLWDVVRAHQCTVFTLLGGMTTALYSEPPRSDDADNPVRRVISAGMPAAIWEEFERRFGVEILEVYGAAEGGLYWNLGGPVGSFGNLRDNPLFVGRVVDEADGDCPAGVPGELVWQPRSGLPPEVEYLNRPDASASKVRGGWFRTGDVVHADAEGWLFFDYRKGGGIRHNGDFVHPGFVEKAIAECESVDDVFVYGVPAASGAPGERDVVAAIVPRDGADLDPQEVFRRCRKALESNFVPSYLQIVDEIPKTASEKPQERFLLEAFRPDAENVHLEQS